MKKLLVLFLLLGSFSTPSAHADIVSNGNIYIKVSKFDDLRKFELCYKSEDDNCTLIGDRTYSLSELNSLRKIFASKFAASTVIVGGALLAPVAAGVATMFEGVVEGIVGFFMMITMPCWTGLFSIAAVGDPTEHYQLMKLMKAQNPSETTVSIEGGDFAIKDIANFLNKHLRKI